MREHAFFPAISLFLYLQVLDVLTTLTGFSLGIPEASPFVRLLVLMGPVSGLFVSKLAAAALAGLCFWMGKPHLLRWINIWYAGLVVWNMVATLNILTAVV